MKESIRNRIQSKLRAFAMRRKPARKPRARQCPRECLRSTRLTAKCEVCSTRPAVVHSPTRVRGFYCQDHCPVCSAPPGATAADVGLLRPVGDAA